MTAIACLGWGSLIWSPRELPVRRGWFNDGPLLPIEFVRQSRDGRITLVLTPNGTPVRGMWAVMSTTNLLAAREALRLREGIGPKRAEEYVGWLGPDGRSEGMCVETIAEWAGRLGLGGVVWTALPPGLRDSPGEAPTSEAVVTYLRQLPAEPRRNAEQYIRRAPAQIDTATRRLVEIELGWTHIRGDRVT